MVDRAPPSLPPLIDNPLAPEFFADEATGFFIHKGNVSPRGSIIGLTRARSRVWLSAGWYCRLRRAGLAVGGL